MYLSYSVCALFYGCGSSKQPSNPTQPKSELRKELKQTAIKQARKEAKMYKKEGFKAFIGGISFRKTN